MIPKRQSDSSDEGKNNRYLPDEMPGIPEEHLNKFNELRQWVEDLNAWWIDVKDILMRQEEVFEKIFGAPISELESTLSDAQNLLQELQDRANALVECCEENKLGIEENATNIGNALDEIEGLKTQIQAILEALGSSEIQQHIEATAAHGSNGDVAGLKDLKDLRKSIDSQMNIYQQNTFEQIKLIHYVRDLGSVDDATSPTIIPEEAGISLFVRYKFLEISPLAGAGVYTIDVELSDLTQVGTVIVLFINGVVSTNPTIRLVKEDASVIHSETLDGSGNSIRVELVTKAPINFKVIQRSTI